jgi:molybdate transport system ATP-binding protein
MTLSARVQARLSTQFRLDVDLHVAPGITMIFGRSGSGKSTLLRTIAGLVRPDAGRVAIDEEVWFDAAAGVDVPVRRRRVGFVFQQLALFPHMTAAENIGYGIARLSAAERTVRVDGVARSFGIERKLADKPDALSGGERQRVALARALVTEPSILLLDEPLSALDHATQSRIMADLRTWTGTHHIPVLYVTHSHRELFALGEQVIVIDEGRVIAEGAPHAVLDEPAHEALAQLAGFENYCDGAIEERRPDAGTMRVRLAESGLHLEVPLTGGTLAMPVRIAIRAADIMLATEEPRGLSARNVLPGRIGALTREGVVVIAVIDAGEQLIAHLSPLACESLALRQGSNVWAIIKTHSCRIVAV